MAKTKSTEIKSSKVSNEIVELLNKTLKNEVAYDLSSLSEDKNIKTWIPSGSRTLDQILSDKPGTGGIPCGRIIEIYGPESCGKSTLAYHIGAECQKLGGMVLYFDVEQVFSKDMADKVGLSIDSKQFIYSDTLVVEDIFEMIETVVEYFAKNKDMQDVPVVVVWDSIAQTMSRKELEGDFDDETPAQAARAITKSLKKIMPVFKKSNIAFVFINQERDKLKAQSFGGEQSNTPGGRLIKYAASIRLRLSKMSTIKDKSDPEERPIGIRVIAETKKNKVASPFRKSEYDIYFDRGIEDYEYVYDLISSSYPKLQYVEKKGNKIFYIDPDGVEHEYQRGSFVEALQRDPIMRNRVYECLEEFRTDGTKLKSEPVELTET